MKIRHPALIRAAGWLGARALRLWMGTVRYRYRILGPDVDPHSPGLAGRYIYAFWHEAMLLPAYRYARPDIHILISRHADGQLIAEIARRLGLRVVRGSTTRGGASAVREMVRLSEKDHLAITPDGPRGPRRQVQPGVVYLAGRTGLPVVPLGVAYRRAWRAKSWDRFALPRPFTTAYAVAGSPVAVPAEVGPEELEPFRLRVQSAMDLVTAAAERWAETGRFPDDPARPAEPQPPPVPGGTPADRAA
ncbi:MAG TPA: lysophospholipid acyltransferase family protein [Gemmataceae bacterium]